MSFLTKSTKALTSQLRLRGGVDPMTLTGAYTLTALDANFLNLDPGGASRDVTLPAVTESNGLVFVIFNAADAAENLVVKNAGGSTIVTIPQAGSATVGCDGSVWSKYQETGTNAGASLLSTANVWTGTNEFGASGTGVDVTFYGDTATRDLVWDMSADSLIFADNAKAVFGSGSDIAVAWDATSLKVTQAAPNSAIQLGVDGAGIDLILLGDTASASCTWDQSADALVFAGVAGIQGVVVKTNGATAITTTRAVTRADSGGIFTVAQSSAYTITVAQPAAAGERYLFQCIAPGAFDVSLVATGCTFEGTITIDGATIPATGSTLKFATGAAVLGDNIELVATSTTKFFVRAIGSGAGGITIA